MKKKTDGKQRVLTPEARAALGEAIEWVRVRSGKNQMQFALDAELPDSSNLSRIISGRKTPSLHTLYCIANAGDVKVSQILAKAEGTDVVEPLPPKKPRIQELFDELSPAMQTEVTRSLEAAVETSRTLQREVGSKLRHVSDKQVEAALKKRRRTKSQIKLKDR